MKCEPVPINASSFADNLSLAVISFAINSSPISFKCKPLQLRFQDDSLATPWDAALTEVRHAWDAKLKDLNFIDAYDRRRFIEFIQEHPAYEQLKDDQELSAAMAEKAGISSSPSLPYGECSIMVKPPMVRGN